jgi:hypothetical protein
MDKSMILKSFNKQFFDFLEDVNRIVENNEDIQTSRIYFDTIKKANPTAIIKVWYKHIYLPYNDIIQQGDISFFSDKDYFEDIGNLKNADSIMKIIDTLRKPIREMGDINKAHTMKYIQNLTELSRAYSEY